MKKIVYIAHPISGNIEENLKDIIRILRIINTNSHPHKNSMFITNERDICSNFDGLRYSNCKQLRFNFENVIPLAPYYADILAFDDNNPEERARGIQNDTALIKSGVFQEIWLTGNKISFGMQCEVELAKKLNIPVIDYINKI